MSGRRVFEGEAGHEIIGDEHGPWFGIEDLLDGLYGKRVRITVDVIDEPATQPAATGTAGGSDGEQG